jgi:glycosyltransferase involved in cell wall biosynthesis
METGESSDKKAPLISVIIPAYNAATCIARTLDSVLAQTMSDYEILVVNDGSPDTPELEASLANYEDKVVYLKQDNRGAAAARNVGVKSAQGQFLAFLDADDYWLPNYLQSQMEVLQKTGADVVYCDALFVGEPRLKGRTYMELAPSRCEVTPESLLAVDVGIISSGVVVAKQAVCDAGLFDETIRRGHDFDLWLRLAKSGVRFACNRRILLCYTISDTGLSGNAISQLQRTLALLERIESRGGLTSTEIAALRLNRNKCREQLALENGKAQLLKRDFTSALESFSRANKMRRSWKVTVVCLLLRMAPGLLWHFYRSRKMAPL